MHIERAQPSDAEELTSIAFAAKRHWRYPDSLIQKWAVTLTIRREYIAAHETWVARLAANAVGFYALVPGQNGEICLDHLWVLPEAMGRGVGRALFTHAMQRTMVLGYARTKIESDPNAVGFYLRMGARQVDVEAEVRSGGDRVLPVLVYDIPGARP